VSTELLDRVLSHPYFRSLLRDDVVRVKVIGWTTASWNEVREWTRYSSEGDEICELVVVPVGARLSKAGMKRGETSRKLVIKVCRRGTW